MSKSKRDILDTEKMLSNLASTLSDNCHAADQPYSEAVADAGSLRRISMTLHRWHELECGTDRGCIERDETTGKPYLTYERMSGTRGRSLINDMERGALKRLKAIMARYPTLSWYVQTDPRGAALYILRPGDVPAGASLDSCYSNGVAVFK
jgi:hypothetical protein